MHAAIADPAGVASAQPASAPVIDYMQELWPYFLTLLILTIGGFFVYRFSEKTNILVDAVVNGLVANAQKNAVAVLICLALALSASIGAFIDNFGSVDHDAMSQLAWWQIVALLAKCANPGIVAIIGFLMKSPLAGKPETTQPPIA